MSEVIGRFGAAIATPGGVKRGLDRTGADNAWRNRGLVEEEIVIIGGRDDDVAALLRCMQAGHILTHLQSGFVGMEEFRGVRASAARQSAAETDAILAAPRSFAACKASLIRDFSCAP